MRSEHWHEWRGEALLLRLRVQPGAARNLIDGLHGQRLRVKVQAPPLEDKANEALLRLMSEAFEVPRQSVSLVLGERSREKTVRILPCRSPPQWFVELGGAVAAPAGSL